MTKSNNNKTKVKNDINKNLVLTLPAIDKLSGVVDIKDKKLCSAIFSNMLDIVNSGDGLAIKVPYKGKYQLAIKTFYPAAGNLIHLKSPSMLLQITHPNCSKYQMRFEYNPHYISEDGEFHLDLIFTELTGLDFYSFLYHATFTRVDFCFNILKSSLNDFFVRSKWSKNAQSFFDKDGNLESLYLGKSGNNQVTVYNKSKQLNGSVGESDTIRVESRRKIKMNISELAKIEDRKSVV